MANTLQIKRGDKVDLPTLSAGEFGLATDTDELYIGNGASNIELVTEDWVTTSVGDPGSDTSIPSEQAVREALDSYVLESTFTQDGGILVGTGAGTFQEETGATARTSMGAAESGGAEHDGFSDFVANEHINHTTVSITAGTGLTGGGTIASTRTINVDVGIGDDKIVQIDDADAADDDYAKFTANGLQGRSYSEVKTDLSLNNVPNEDATDPANWDPANTDGNFLVGNGSTFVAESGSTARTSMGAAESGGAEHDGFSDFVANEHINHTSVTLTAGNGLTGGGDISTNRTFTVGTPGTLNSATTNSVTASSHTHEIDTIDGGTIT